MKQLSHILAFVAICCFTEQVSAQQGNLVLGFEGWGGYTSNETVPFWLRSNQYGSIPLDGASLSLIGFARKDYDQGKEKLFDWGASFEGRANLGQGSDLTLIEGYGKARLGIFELRAGRSKKISGLCDTALTSGSWAISGSNLGIPEVELSVRDFWTLPILGQLVAFKGNFSHGWFGDVPMQQEYISTDTTVLNTYLHQKSFYVRFGKPAWKLKLYGGFNHQVLWGNENEYYHDDFTLTPFNTYLYVITGKKFNNGLIQAVRLGDHLGSIDIGVEYAFKRIKVVLYRQNLFDAGALAHLANVQDGLNGLIIENQQNEFISSGWHKILFEFLYTKNQAGEAWSPSTPSPYEGYFNHSQYLNGWSFHADGLGSPFISTRRYLREELPTDPKDYFVNNRVIAFHLGCEWSFKDIRYVLKTSWSKNYGTYRTTTQEQSTNIPDPGAYGIFGEQKQISTYLEASKELTKFFNIGLIGAFDYGTLFYNSFGVFLKASYAFNF